MFKSNYYWIFIYLSKLKRSSTPGFDSILFVGILQFFNMLTIAKIVYSFINYKMSKDSSIYLGLILAAAMLIFNYYYLFKRRNTIMKEMEEYPADKRKTSEIVFLSYVLFSIVALVIVCNYT